jgi:predicted phosphohydrolase
VNDKLGFAALKPMTSDRQILANRCNAKKSTGPRTESGKKRVRANALKHGLSARTLKPMVHYPPPRSLGSKTSGLPSGDLPIEEAKLRLTVIERYRQGLMALVVMLIDGRASQVTTDHVITKLRRLDRYERRLYARLHRLESRQT